MLVVNTKYLAVVACHHGLNTDKNKIQIEVKHKDKSATKNILNWTECVRCMPSGRHISVFESTPYQYWLVFEV